jgi:Flp pilus assembly protein protease CpaA
MVGALGLVALALLLLVAAARNLATLVVPNRIPLAMAGVFVGLAPFSLENRELPGSLVAGLGVLAVGIALFSMFPGS